MSQFDDTPASSNSGPTGGSIDTNSFLAMLEANLKNSAVTDHAFRDFVRATLPMVARGSSGSSSAPYRSSSQFDDRPSNSQFGDH